MDKSYAPLFFSPQDYFYDIGYDDKHTSRFSDAIVNDWTAYLQGKITREDVAFFMLNDSSKASNEKSYAAIQKKQPAARSADRSDAFFEFLHYASLIEVASTTPIDPWSYDEKKESVWVDFKVISQVEKLYNESKNPFLKNRYWFQTMKAYFYSGNKQSAITFFDKTKASVPVNALYYRALSYVAGAHYSRKNYGTSNYLYSVVFDKSPELRTVATYNFHPQEQQDFAASLALAKSPDEKAALWALFGYYADENTAIREIYKLNPASPHLDYLLTRLVNKEEVSLNASTFKSADDYRRTIKNQLNKDALALVNTLAKEEKTAKPYLWNLAAGYFNILAGNYAEATQHLDKVEKKAPKSDMATRQLRLMRLMNALSATMRMDTQAESKLLPELTWLYNTVTKNTDDVFRYHHALDWSKRFVASLYKSQQNAVFAELFDRNESFYRTTTNTELMKQFLAKSVKSPWENLAVSIYEINLSDIFEYQSIISAYAGNLDAAITYMEQAPGAKDTELQGNPFNGKIKDCHDCDHAAVQKTKYTKLSFLKKMKEMKALVDSNQDVYNNALLLGNAYYNMSYFGNARMFYYGDIVNQYGNYIDKYYQPMLFSCATASQYYQKAFDVAANPEQKAKCAYMLAKCERNEFYATKYHSQESFYDEPEVSFLAWNGFKKLKTEYAATKYYKEVINECGYFRKYASRK